MRKALPYIIVPGIALGALALSNDANAQMGQDYNKGKGKGKGKTIVTPAPRIECPENYGLWPSNGYYNITYNTTERKEDALRGQLQTSVRNYLIQNHYADTVRMRQKVRMVDKNGCVHYEGWVPLIASAPTNPIPIPIKPDTTTPKPIEGMQWNLRPEAYAGIFKRVERDTNRALAKDITALQLGGRAILYKSDDLKIVGGLDALIGSDEEQAKDVAAGNAHLGVYRTFPYLWLSGKALYEQDLGNQGFLYALGGLRVGNAKIQGHVEGGPGFDVTEGNGQVTYKAIGGLDIIANPAIVKIRGVKERDPFMLKYVNRADLDLTLRGKKNSATFGGSIITPYDSDKLLDNTGRETAKNTELEARVRAEIGLKKGKIFGQASARGLWVTPGSQDAYTRKVGQGNLIIGYEF